MNTWQRQRQREIITEMYGGSTMMERGQAAEAREKFVLPSRVTWTGVPVRDLLNWVVHDKYGGPVHEANVGSAGRQYRFRENELGALLWALQTGQPPLDFDRKEKKPMPVRIDDAWQMKNMPPAMNWPTTMADIPATIRTAKRRR
jgi:hypothetical protein